MGPAIAAISWSSHYIGAWSPTVGKPSAELASLAIRFTSLNDPLAHRVRWYSMDLAAGLMISWHLVQNSIVQVPRGNALMYSYHSPPHSSLLSSILAAVSRDASIWNKGPLVGSSCSRV